MGKWEHKVNEDKTSSRRVLIEYFQVAKGFVFRVRFGCLTQTLIYRDAFGIEY